jgi:hypothetical protein
VQRVDVKHVAGNDLVSNVTRSAPAIGMKPVPRTVTVVGAALATTFGTTLVTTGAGTTEPWAWQSNEASPGWKSLSEEPPPSVSMGEPSPLASS